MVKMIIVTSSSLRYAPMVYTDSCAIRSTSSHYSKTTSSTIIRTKPMAKPMVLRLLC